MSDLGPKVEKLLQRVRDERKEIEQGTIQVYVIQRLLIDLDWLLDHLHPGHPTSPLSPSRPRTIGETPE